MTLVFPTSRTLQLRNEPVWQRWVRQFGFSQGSYPVGSYFIFVFLSFFFLYPASSSHSRRMMHARMLTSTHVHGDCQPTRVTGTMYNLSERYMCLCACVLVLDRYSSHLSTFFSLVFCPGIAAVWRCPPLSLGLYLSPPLFYTLAWRGDTLLSACLITVVPIKLSFASRSRAAPSLTQYCAQQKYLDEVGAGGCGIVDTLDISLPPPPMFCA